MAPLPGEKLQVGVRPEMTAPFRSRAVTLKSMTSPVRTLELAGVISSDASVLAMTCTFTFWSTVPVLAEMTALPGATAVTTPSSPTLATAGAELRQVNLSCCARPWPPSSWWRSCGGAGPPPCGRRRARTTTEAAGPGTIRTSTFSTTGLVPATVAMTETPRLPVEPDWIRPVLSTLPSKRPPAGMYL